MRSITYVASAAAIFLGACTCHADAISFSMSSRVVTLEEGGPGGAPAGGRVISFFVTTDGDVLSVGNVLISGFSENSGPKAPYQHVAGANAAPPNPVIVSALPALGAVSYIDTPGNTTILGTDMPGDGSPNSAWGDLSDDGPQTNFKFAQLTFAKGEGWRFRGNVTIAGATGPFSAPFDFPFPEPASSMLAVIGTLGLAAVRRQFGAA
jgi:hypothetical protein